MPANNTDFGRKTAEFYLLDPDDANRRVFDIYEAPVKVYFPEEATNNPDGTVHNWYYYWSQTAADYGTHNYDTAIGRSYTDFFSADGLWKSIIGTDANESGAAGTWNDAEGIDFFANICRHEERHRLDLITLWGASSDRVPANDNDTPFGDYLPTNNGTVTENSLGTPYHSGGYDPTLTVSFIDHMKYGFGWSDIEDYCMHREVSWTNGTADSVDWACPGHQYN